MDHKKNKHESDDEEKWVYDSSVDYKGRVPLRASTGAWKASLFIIGVTAMMPLIGGFLADAYLGRFSMVLASSIIYLLGLLLLTMSRIIPGLKPCSTGPCPEPRKLHEIFFFLAMYSISIGTGGHKPALESFGADQFDDDHPEERKKKMSFFNWWSFGLCCGLLLGVTVIVYIQDHVGWAASDIVLTSVMAFTVVIFCIGRPFYRFRKPNGSPLTPMVQVIVAAFVKRNIGYPSGPEGLYEVAKLDRSQGTRLLFHTDKLRFLDKAAIIEDTQNPQTKPNPWRLQTVTKIEELKLLINMIPIWLTTLPFGIVVAQSNTFFIKQSTTLNRKITPNFTIPPASMYALAAVGLIVSIAIYDRALVPLLRKLTRNERHRHPPQDRHRVLITLVDYLSGKLGGKSWFGEDLNSSRLDCFYWLLAGITAVNLCVYGFVARRYCYKNVVRGTTSVGVGDCCDEGKYGVELETLA
ncbi:hypothetical protein DH2020_040246 [Rehmannia glutinosa]|uniref:Uncharacterized protein n=1 Tax=Rehmannia glutinosa TaxID=99300 RepID=A0ABR0UTI4_REHGL